MNRRTKIVSIAYGAWATAFFLMAVLGKLFAGHGEYGISTHLWLTLTGMPLSFISWALPHGSVYGVAVAGIAGIIQWSVVSEFRARRDSRENGSGT